MKLAGLNLANDAANTIEAVIADNVDFLDLTLRGKKTHLKINGTAIATPAQGAAWYGTLILLVGGGNLYTVNAGTGTVTNVAAAAFHASNPVSINTDGMPGYAIICDGTNTPKVWDGSALRVMGPPAAPVAAPVLSVAAPSTASASVNAATGTNYSTKDEVGATFKWTGANSIVTRLNCNRGGATAIQFGAYTATFDIYESSVDFSSSPKEGNLIKSGMLIHNNADIQLSLSDGVMLRANFFYSIVVYVPSVSAAMTIGGNTSFSYTGTVSSGSTWYNASGAWTKVASSVSDIGISVSGLSLNGVFQYAYTYYNSTRALESDLSPSGSISPAYQTVGIPVLASAESGVDKIRIYRIGGAHSAYVLVVELSNAGATHTDYAADGSLSVSCTSIGNAKPPTALKEIMFLPDAGCLIGYKDDGTLYASKPNGSPQDVEIWPGVNAYPIGSVANPIQGICINQTSVVAIRKNGAVKIAGSSPETLYFAELKDAQGTSARRSVAAGINGGFFLGSEAVSSIEYLATPIKIMELRNKILANYQNGGEVGFYWNKQYFLASATAAEVLVLDGRFHNSDFIPTTLPREFIPTTLPLSVKCFFTDGQNLYYADSLGDIYKYEGGASRGNWDWQGVAQNLGDQFAKKNVEEIEFDYNGNITVTPYLDGVAQSTIALSSGSRARYNQPFNVLSAYRYQLRFQGTNATAELFGFRLSGQEELITGN